MTESIEIKHDDTAIDWALTPERVSVFHVLRANPARVEWDARDSHSEDEEAPPAELRFDYDMPAVPNAGLALKYLKHARVNADLAASWLLELALGEEGYDALTDELAAEPDSEKAQATMQSVVTFVAKRALGGLSGKA